jgi:hypothetical protein
MNDTHNALHPAHPLASSARVTCKVCMHSVSDALLLRLASRIPPALRRPVRVGFVALRASRAHTARAQLRALAPAQVSTGDIIGANAWLLNYLAQTGNFTVNFVVRCRTAPPRRCGLPRGGCRRVCAQLTHMPEDGCLAQTA